MGGYGSGRWGWHTRRTTVEECLRLPVSVVVSKYPPGPGRHSRGELTWKRGEEVTSTIGYELDSGPDASRPLLRLIYKRTGAEAGEDYRFPLTSTGLPWGGRRWWYICPGVVNGKPCLRRAGTLYLPPGGRIFACRSCYRLTYESCNESHKSDGLYRLLARNMGTDFESIKRSFKELGRRRGRW